MLCPLASLFSVPPCLLVWLVASHCLQHYTIVSKLHTHSPRTESTVGCPQERVGSFTALSALPSGLLALCFMCGGAPRSNSHVLYTSCVLTYPGFEPRNASLSLRSTEFHSLSIAEGIQVLLIGLIQFSSQLHKASLLTSHLAYSTGEFLCFCGSGCVCAILGLLSPAAT